MDNIPPVLYDKHVRYLNFSKFTNGLIDIGYINFVREPISRLVSSYYYSILGPRKEDKKQMQRQRRGAQADLNINECVALPESDRQCGFRHASQGGYNVMTSFFCGHDVLCQCLRLEPSSEANCTVEKQLQALELAKSNMRTKYAMIGVLEHTDVSLRLLEQVLPAAFEGISRHVLPQERISQKDPRYVAPNEATQRILEQYLWMDLEVYKYAVELLRAKSKGCLHLDLEMM